MGCKAVRGKRAVLILFAALCLTASGCGALFEREYFYAADYQESEIQHAEGDAAAEIADYSSLRAAIEELVSQHASAGVLTFSGYDGDISGDLAQACWEVSADTPLGAYSVDYMSYDLSRIVSYYEAQVYIMYKRSAEQTASITRVNGAAGLRECLAENLGGYEQYFAVSVTSATLTAESVEEFVRTLYLNDPVGLVVCPELAVNVYPKDGVRRIFEISVDFGLPPEQLAGMSAALLQATSAAAGQTPDGLGEAMTAYRLAELLAEACEPGEGGMASTAYGALVEGKADSEGFAMAYSVLCREKGIDCVTVQGRFDNAPHYWSIAELDGAYYHIDLSRFTESGPAAVFLRSDAEMWERYWWDSGDYPA